MSNTSAKWGTNETYKHSHRPFFFWNFAFNVHPSQRAEKVCNYGLIMALLGLAALPYVNITFHSLWSPTFQSLVRHCPWSPHYTFSLRHTSPTQPFPHLLPLSNLCTSPALLSCSHLCISWFSPSSALTHLFLSHSSAPAAVIPFSALLLPWRGTCHSQAPVPPLIFPLHFPYWCFSSSPYFTLGSSPLLFPAAHLLFTHNQVFPP